MLSIHETPGAVLAARPQGKHAWCSVSAGTWHSSELPGIIFCAEPRCHFGAIEPFHRKLTEMPKRLPSLRHGAQLRVSVLLVFLTVLVADVRAQKKPAPARQRAFQEFREDYLVPLRRSYNIQGTDRTALVFAPKTAPEMPTPVVFLFHGHGGTAMKLSKTLPLHNHWKEAIVVYMQGLVRPTRRDPEGFGWVIDIVPTHENEDLLFFDHVLASLCGEYQVDRNRVYSAGHSNGGFFTYQLWSRRPEALAAIAPIASFIKGTPESETPLPQLHIAGREDPLVPLDEQMKSVEHFRRINECNDKPETPKTGTRVYQSAVGAPVVTIIHPGKHEIPRLAAPAIAKFFKRQQRAAPAQQE